MKEFEKELVVLKARDGLEAQTLAGCNSVLHHHQTGGVAYFWLGAPSTTVATTAPTTLMRRGGEADASALLKR